MITAKDLIRKDVIKIDAGEVLSKLLGKISKDGEISACIFEGEEFLGLFSPFRFMKSRANIAKTKVKNYVQYVPTVDKNNTLREIASQMYEANTTMLPVIGKKFQGIVHIFDVLAQIKEIEELQEIKVQDVRHPIAITLFEDQTLGEAFHLMVEHRLLGVPVLANNETLSGFLSYGDIIKKYFLPYDLTPKGARPTLKTKAFDASKENIFAMPVKNFMESQKVFQIKKHEKITTAAQVMIQNKVYGLVVEDEPYSIITKKDLLEAIANAPYMEPQNIEFVNLNEMHVSKAIKKKIEKVAAFHAEKIGFLVKNAFSMRIHFKEYKKEGKRHKYSIHLQVFFARTSIATDKAHDWDIVRALHKGFEDLKNRIRHKYKQRRDFSAQAAMMEG